jgi:hypothetical protein
VHVFREHHHHPSVPPSETHTDWLSLMRYPTVKTAPLPAAQFLNIIESVFSGMSRAVIHNSDYPSVGATQQAIDDYFAKRNESFRNHPKRAGGKIWESERVSNEFREGNNCKDPLYR